MRQTLTTAGYLSALPVLISIALAGCEEANTYVEPPPPKVSVAQPLVQGVKVAKELVSASGRCAGV